MVAPVSLVYNTGSRSFDRDRKGLAAMTLANIGTALGNQKGSVLTFMGVPPGGGKQLGIDRNLDGVLDGDEAGVHYGSASPTCATVIRIAANSAPTIGNTQFAVVVTGAPANALGWVLGSPNRATAKFVDLEPVGRPERRADPAGEGRCPW